MMTDDSMKKDKSSDNFYLPYLVLLGIVVCESDARQRAQAFVEIFHHHNNTFHISSNSRQLQEFYMRLMEIACDFMIHFYYVSHPNLRVIAALEHSHMWDESFHEMFEEFLDYVFDTHTKLDKDELTFAFTKRPDWITPYRIRSLVCKKVQTIIKQQKDLIASKQSPRKQAK